MNIRTYPGKIFLINDDKAFIRDENGNEIKYQAGEVLPPGAHVGDTKMIPNHTQINVTDVKALDRKNVLIFARPAGDATSAFGWTKPKNVVGKFLGEVTGFAPSRFEKEPEGNNKTCFDPQALIRGGPPNFASTGAMIPQGTFLMVTETSADKLNVKVKKLELVNGEMVVGDEIGWTRVSNLADGCSSDSFVTAEWFDHEGPNGCWLDGHFLFPKVLVNIIGVNIEMEQTTFDSIVPYMKMANAARDEAGLLILINTAFRTFQRQAALFAEAQSGGHNAAPPGKSNHQHGQAFDLNVDYNLQTFIGRGPIYEWLKKNGPKHGFIRTVNKEPWHWEYVPDRAEQMGPGEFKFPSTII